LARAALIVTVAAFPLTFEARPDSAGGTHTLDGPVSLQWESRVDGPAHGDDAPVAAVRSSDGALLVAAGSGVADAAQASDFLTVAFNTTTGDTVWTQFFNGPADLADGATGVAFNPGETSVIVTGSARGATGADYATIAYVRSTGAVQWTSAYDGPVHGHDLAHGVCTSPADGTVFVTGESPGDGTLLDVTTVALDPADGSPLWTARTDGPSAMNDIGWAVASPADGTRVLVAGESHGGASGADAVVVAFDAANGGQDWEARYDGPAHSADRVDTIACSPDGTRAFAAGRSRDGAGRLDLLLLSVTVATGEIVWATRYNGPPGLDDAATGLTVAPDGQTVFVTGWSAGYGTGFDFVTLAINADTGQTLWVKRYDGPAHGDDSARGLAVRADGGLILVTGQSASAAGPDDQLTIAYDPGNGSVLWSARYDGPDQKSDIGRAVAASPDLATTLVVGESATGDGTRDFVAVAYRDAFGVSLRAPTAGAVLSSQASGRAATFAPPSPVASVALWGNKPALGDVELASQSTPDPDTGEYAFDWSTIVDCQHEGQWTLWAVATDSNAMAAHSDPITVTVNNVTFPDVPCTHFAWRFVEAVARNGIASGFPDGTYKPDNTVNRGQMAIFMSRSADLTLGDFASFTPPACGSEHFGDVACTHPSYKFIEYVAAKGIASGFPDGTYKPGNGVSRGAMAVFLSRLRNLSDGDFAAFAPPACGSESFPDVLCGNASYKFIEYVKSKGIAAGFPDGTDKPANIVTRGQMAVFITRAASLPF